LVTMETYVLRVRPRVRHVINSIVRVNTLQVATTPLRLLDMAIVQVRIRRVLAVTIPYTPRSHEVRDVRQAAIAARATIVRNRLILPAVELDDGHVLAARVAVDDNSLRVAVLVRGALVVGSRDTGERCDASGSHGVTGEDVGREAAAVAFAGRVDLVWIDAVLVGDRVDHVEGEADVVGLGGWVALPLLVDTLRVGDQHVLVLG